MHGLIHGQKENKSSSLGCRHTRGELTLTVCALFTHQDSSQRCPSLQWDRRLTFTMAFLTKASAVCLWYTSVYHSHSLKDALTSDTKKRLRERPGFLSCCTGLFENWVWMTDQERWVSPVPYSSPLATISIDGHSAASSLGARQKIPSCRSSAFVDFAFWGLQLQR